jgi:predicted ribosome quality control (RQC) complex YloA/Tae2 family protein
LPLDAICLSAVTDELRGKIIGARIDKVQQPERDVLLLSLRGSSRLFISAGAGDARLHLTEASYENPASPPMFCMLLRKHLIGARILSLTQPPGERVAELALGTADAMGEPCEKRLVLELMGRNSNIILVAGDGVIIDCLRRVDAEMSEKRQVLPGLFYHLPPPQEKINPLETPLETWLALSARANPEKTVSDWLLETFSALPPLICREIAFRAYGDAEIQVGVAVRRDAARALAETSLSLMRDRAPCLLLGADGTPRDFSYTEITQYADASRETERDFSALLERFFTRRAAEDRARQKSSALTKTIRNARDRVRRKLENQREELKKTADRSYLRECGDLITASLRAVKKGESVLRARDYYAEDGAIREIRLDPKKTPQQNAARYYKEYTKAKNAESFLTEQLAAGERELQYLESVLEEIAEAAGERDLLEIRQELADTGYVKQRKTDKKEKRRQSAPRRFVSGSGFVIQVGRNNTQNDRLTLKTAFKTDVWLHAQKLHGSHVVISADGRAVDDATILEAAALAAYYSEARASGRAAVDYCPVKFVKKPPGARPGMVIYTDYKTALVSPDAALAETRL